jgi:hypothetical protein
MLLRFRLVSADTRRGSRPRRLACAAIFGDSGSPVRVTDLRAAGDLTHLVVDTNWLPSFIAGTRIGKILQIATGWTLVDSPLCV